jgi:outer membrane protein OmpA-like peptidoglycan-associated protein
LKNVYAQRLAAATALALLTAGVPAMAERGNLQSNNFDDQNTGSIPNSYLQLAQAELTEEEKQKKAEEAAAAEKTAAEAAAAEKAAAEAAAAEKAAAEAAAAEKAAAEAAAAEKAAAEAAAAEKAAAEAAAAEKAAAEAAAAEKAAAEAAAAEKAAADAAAAEKAAAEAAAAEKAAAEAAAAEKAAADAATQKAAEEQKPAEQDAPATTEPAQAEQPAAENPTRAERQKQREERQKAREERKEQRKKDGQQAEPAQSADPAQPPAETAQPAVPVLPGSDTPVLDSQKEPAAPAEGGQQTAQPTAPAKPAGPPPTSDKDAQKETVKVEDIKPVTQEEGKRVEGDRRPRRERHEGSDVLREIDGRVIINLGGRPVVESSDRPRIERDAREVYYEELPRGRTRETIIRPNGVQIVTVRDRYGEVIRRSRITPDGREYVLVYVDEERRGPRDGRWRDPGADLPPLVLTIPANEYILDAEEAEDEDDYYDFLDQPPVERVERLYSVDEVKRSARVRDTVRRVDLDTITFEFGSAEIKEDAIGRLDNVAKAMEKMLKQNPAETFLIEGHTDAVGSDMANLALSDRRAEAVAAALTDVFEIPPENLTTQGYGEQYLKVKTEAPEERNRRVAIRRITPLVAPVASAQ